MYGIYRRILFLLVAFAVLGVTTAEAARPVAFADMSGDSAMPCDMTMPAEMTGGMDAPSPCKGMTPDCIKMMGCVTISALPAHFVSAESAVEYRTVIYWTADPELAGQTPAPEPQPPRTA